jgi:hypothetical protein
MRPDVSARVGHNCVRSLRRGGWPRLICGRDRNRAASAQVKAKSEDLPHVMSPQAPRPQRQAGRRSAGTVAGHGCRLLEQGSDT